MNELTHWGIKGQKWGVRRYQNPDGTLTEAGKKRYQVIDKLKKKEVEETKRINKAYSKSTEGKAYKEWRKKNPYADIDSFGDYMVDNNIPDFESEGGNRYNRYRGEILKLQPGYVKDEAKLGAAISTITLAPLSYIATKGITGSGKAAILAALGSISYISMSSAKRAKKEVEEIEKKYGLN